MKKFLPFIDNQRGAIPILLIVGIIGILGIMAMANLAPFKNSFMASLYPKDWSFASVSGPISEPVTSPTPTPNPNIDSDGDKFTDGQEAFMGTNPQKACPTNGDDAWPIDVNNDTVINGGDTSTLVPYIQGTKAYSKRYDLDQNGKIDLFDANIIQPNMLKTCGPQPSVTPTPTPTPSPSTSPSPTPAGFSLDRTQVSIEVNSKDAVNGVILGPGIKITSAPNAYADTWVIDSNKVNDGFGFWVSASGMTPGTSMDNQLYISANKTPGTYTGKAKISYYKSGKLVQNGPELSYTIILKTAKKAVFGDWTGDGKADFAYYRPSTTGWFVKARELPATGQGWGAPTDIPVMGDYNGDGKMDKAVYRPAIATWYIDNENPNGTKLGNPNDLPVPADYNGDGKMDKAVYQTNGQWLTSVGSIGWGKPGNAIPVPADYNGDGKAEPAWFNPTDGKWFIQSNPSYVPSWGGSGDIPVPADYNGDGKADIAVFRPSNGTWYIGAAGYSIYGYGWGTWEDIPVPADYAGEGKARFAVFRPSNGTWYVFPNADFSIYGSIWGQKGDIPTPKRPTFPAYPF